MTNREEEKKKKYLPPMGLELGGNSLTKFDGKYLRG